LRCREARSLRRGRIDASGQETPQQRYYREYAGGEDGARYRSTLASRISAPSAICSATLFGERRRHARGPRGARFSMRGSDSQYRLDVDFLDAVNGTKTRITLPDGGHARRHHPARRYRRAGASAEGKGNPGIGEGEPGDALIEIHVRPNPVFKREGNDIVVEVPITFDEAVLGGKIEVPTIGGRVFATVPPGSNTGQTLRLKGRGIKTKGSAGDQLVKLSVVLPDRIDDDLKRFAETWREAHRYDPRRKLEGAGLMLSERDLVASVQHLTVTRLRVWVKQGLIKPADQTAQASPKPISRGPRSICNLEDQLGFAEEDVPVLLNLIDQIHGLRSELLCLLGALDDLPPDVRATVKMRIESRRGGTAGMKWRRSPAFPARRGRLHLSQRFAMGRTSAGRHRDRSRQLLFLCAVHHAIIVSLVLPLPLAVPPLALGCTSDFARP
jgi:hypothetical protein